MHYHYPTNLGKVEPTENEVYYWESNGVPVTAVTILRTDYGDIYAARVDSALVQLGHSVICLPARATYLYDLTAQVTLHTC